MKPEDLKGEAKALYESFRGMGLAEAAAMSATVGRAREISMIESGRTFGRLTRSEAARQIAAVKARPAAASAALSEAAYDRRSARVYNRPTQGS